MFRIALVCLLVILCDAQGVLRKGDSGPEVEALQSRLVTLGLLPERTAAGLGFFDSTTEGALISFQQKQGLSDDGVAGPATLAALNLSGTSSVNSALRASVAGREVIQGTEGNPTCGGPPKLKARCSAPCGNKDPPNSCEGAEPSESCAYYDQKCILTIGWGHIHGVRADTHWTQDRVEAAYAADTKYAGQVVSNAVAHRVLTQEQFDALVDFCFNAGCQKWWSKRALAVIDANPDQPIDADLLFKEMYENTEPIVGNKVRYMKAWSIVTGRPIAGDLKSVGSTCYGRLEDVVRQGTCQLPDADPSGTPVFGSCPMGSKELTCFVA